MRKRNLCRKLCGAATGKKPEAPVVPPLVPQAAGGGAAAVGTFVGSKPAGEKKRKQEEKAADAGGKKRSRIQIKRITAVSQVKPVVAAGTGANGAKMSNKEMTNQLGKVDRQGPNKNCHYFL
ncbi:hypothetical protein HanXRQr2_Chr14g0645351 [Helianthus annuus]|uniref:Uncharacterized protein n=1 Tax=Helianthus annuus TaxID=4232 RepID=A0A9K3E8M2_HELAN|nr:hypothetical protein HanXRQr2_Chr14g0645351 [Helianthus annuus]KAJ0464265.1 hypothetical protein HanHA300_Chr14g0525191 [Helianthus annuus]KAJ0485838.1 hypothetical protein HanHA89_Chr14g0572931 [Helianthus annuus]KAJ0656391.1 hypothetical protein HanLR1_Chr14g0535331 [Helianthus annuus]KAJ0840475.1 hypothetical protein HanPSC8_Chr14g0619251 [Helianthus annuus]